MSPQTAVNDEPDQAYEGKVHVGGQYATTYKSFLAAELIYFGKAVVLSAPGDLAVGGASGGPQTVKLPAAAAEVTDQFLGIAPSDPSVQRTSTAGVSDPFGAYIAETSVQVLRKGMVWVVVGTALAALNDGVFVRFQAPGGTPPTESLGSFDTVTSINHQIISAGLLGGISWAGSAVINGANFGLLEINVP